MFYSQLSNLPGKKTDEMEHAKKTHNIVTKEHYVNYCGSLCNPEDAFVLEAFIFCAAANVHVSHALNQAHRRGKEGIICQYVFLQMFFWYYMIHLKFYNEHIFGTFSFKLVLKAILNDSLNIVYKKQHHKVSVIWLFPQT